MEVRQRAPVNVMCGAHVARTQDVFVVLEAPTCEGTFGHGHSASLSMVTARLER